MKKLYLCKEKNIDMTVNFYILVPDRKGLYNIEMRCVHNKVRMRYNTKIKVRPEQWDKKKQQCKNSDMASTVNQRLWVMRNIAIAFPNESEVISNEAFVKFVDNVLYPKQVIVNSIDSAMDEFIANIGNRINSNGEVISKGRVANYKRLVGDFKRFESERGVEYRTEEMNAKTVGAFLDWLRIDRNLAPNTLQSRMKMLRAMLAGIAKNHSLHTDYKDARVKGEVVEHIVLSDSEMDMMMNYDTRDNPRLDNVRRLFIIGITTGLRFSDFTHVKLEHIAGGILSIHQQKTGSMVQIPIHPMLQEIIDDGNMPKPISNQRFNVYLRELAQFAGVDSPVEVKTVQGGVRKTKFVPKYELVSSHICRRSFASRLYRLGINPKIIMKLTGHKQLSTFMSYIVINDEDVLNSVRNIW